MLFTQYIHASFNHTCCIYFVVGLLKLHLCGQSLSATLRHIQGATERSSEYIVFQKVATQFYALSHNHSV